MAATFFRAPALPLSLAPSSQLISTSLFPILSFNTKQAPLLNLQLSSSPSALRRRLPRFAAATSAEDVEENVAQDSLDEGTLIDDETSKENSSDGEEVASTISVSLQAYREALLNGDQAKIEEIETLFQSIEDEKNSLKTQVIALAAELSIERDRILRISADFDNFRKRTERERLSLMSNAQGEVVESLLPILDNFERAKDQLKIETVGEEKINNSYQSIYKQFVEILKSLGVETVETVGKNFDPLIHEAIMREESTEFEEGIVIQEFRKGFRLGDRLLRPAMVKVSAGPGPKKPEGEDAPTVVEGSETTEESNNDGGDDV